MAYNWLKRKTYRGIATMAKDKTREDTAIIPQQQNEDIKELILTIRGMQVILDNDVARLYGYETKYINLAAKRNENRFPPEFRFQLTQEEYDRVLRSRFATSKQDGSSRLQTATLNDGGESDSSRLQTATLKNRRGSNIKYLPWVYSEHGVIALAGVLRSQVAAEVSIGIVKAFVEMRKFINANRDVFAKLVSIDNKLLEYDRKFDEVFDLLQQPEAIKQLIFYKGELYDAQAKLIEFIKEAKDSLIIIDNYASSAVLDMLSEKQSGVDVTIITASPGMISQQRQQSFSAQYGALRIVESHDFHDRFIIVDGKDVYAVGASLKDAGKRCFEVSKNEDTTRFLTYVQSVIV
jgi:hypothetical protein